MPEANIKKKKQPKINRIMTQSYRFNTKAVIHVLLNKARMKKE
jgi:hypothetical protein